MTGPVCSVWWVFFQNIILYIYIMRGILLEVIYWGCRVNRGCIGGILDIILEGIFFEIFGGVAIIEFHWFYFWISYWGVNVHEISGSLTTGM